MVESDRTEVDDDIERAEAELKRKLFYWRWSLAGYAGGYVLVAAAITGAVLLNPGLVGFAVYGMISLIVATVALFVKHDELSKVRTSIQRFRTIRREILADQAGHSLGVNARYREDLSDLIDQWTVSARKYRRLANMAQLTTVFGSLAATALTWFGAGQGYSWAGPTLMVLVAATAAVNGIFKFRDRALSAQLVAGQVARELRVCSLRVGPYKDMTEHDALVLLAERVEEYREAQTQREYQLDQPADVQSPLAGSPSQFPTVRE